LRKLFLFACIFALVGCGGGGGGGGSDHGVTFWAIDCRDSAPDSFPHFMYTLKADKVGEGEYCYIYLERNGRRAAEPDIPAIIYQFDSLIYPKLRAAYGNEPYQDIDGDPKVYILLLDIRDDWNGTTIGAYVGGYFFYLDQYDVHYSNKKKIFYMDIYPGNPNPSYSRFTDFRRFRHTLAHEFQHMIHWNITKGRNPNDNNTWLNEAMSEAAPYYAFNEISMDRVSYFEGETEGIPNHSNSLTRWGPPYPDTDYSYLLDYAVVYMWGQYMADRFPDNVFMNILANNADGGGKTAVVKYFSSLNQEHSLYPEINFASVFRDWSLAVFFGDNTSATVSTDNASWAYKTNTSNRWPGYHNKIYSNSSFNFNNGLRTLDQWSLGYYRDYTLGGDFTWSLTGPSELSASFYTDGSLTPSMSRGDNYPYNGEAYLILQNAQGADANPNLSISPASTQVFSTQTQPRTPPTPAEKLRAISQSAAVPPTRRGATEPTEPIPVCIQDILSWRAEEIQRQMQGR